jgi:DNA-nicking Smr family endonuclease
LFGEIAKEFTKESWVAQMAKDLLDLHGYKTDQVEAAIDRFLMQLSDSQLKRARIMTGKGTGAVQSLTIKYLKMAGYHWAYEKLSNGKNNEGCLIVFLD